MELFLKTLINKSIENEYFDDYMSTAENWAFYLKRDMKDWDYLHDDTRTYEKIHEVIKILDWMGHYKTCNIKGFCKVFAEEGVILASKWQNYQPDEADEVAEFLIVAFGCAASFVDVCDESKNSK